MNPYLHLVVWLSLFLSAPILAIFANKLKKRGQEKAAETWFGIALCLLILFLSYPPLVNWLARLELVSGIP
ncbi:hypothetical protein A3I99_03485 [Candidatus Kaiserbacteria bacterium RIFCSPLOWO2_02_FULL_45_11b]|uniref:Uncharacterized protein n=1 Tax=Candidatus Kaiserbacteria bacterium RIFCSPLOWO2_12_FULL_45_26 TaxID=1798525 RepID=A0A1F6FH13_9BACT|nr:MAG: hypothetical protein A2Z56_02700 [Candidatus Kaiserbacteria bacterium RIFCSPHIGHO2_12_45_16]OGG69988.1 MAG: hypothetical protein A2929_02360 [Candidatus Kaiserbacteria bacterium RIFCSPLOWO2_01_FULL_45_25]OGG83657.1 MAG: hypothetical protein A3I99_03485 [Candidatus Kaiserbacteria bacterium RIFCSPLOWO2_02_FULL_45_11b]OGG85148.1 MAG: hypothetical protein A3G90_03770 [Candidatus Kaiserbacteria bacterium RIFCSPLOWO2_12_FULL_45_26]